jgi:hypothetical protein
MNAVLIICYGFITFVFGVVIGHMKSEGRGNK